MKDYRDVIIRPIITEATMKMMAEDNKVTFEVKKCKGQQIIMEL